MADQQVALERLRELYREKNEHLEKFLEPVEPYEFYREIFPEGSFERKGHFEDRKGNGIAVTVAKSEVDKATGIALQIEGDGKAKRCTVTDELDELRELQDTDFTIMSPISYFGRRRCGKNARYLYALVFDLDGVGMPQLRDTLHQMNKDILPQATFVVNSGTGLHLYYVLKEPVPMYPYNQKCLKELKYSLTRQIWNKFTSTIKEPQMQGILQGFRVVGSGSKLGREYPVRAFRLGGPVELARLLDYIPDSNGEQQRLEGLMRKSRLSLAEAKEKYPDWYERRIIKKAVSYTHLDVYKRQVFFTLFLGLLTLVIIEKVALKISGDGRKSKVTKILCQLGVVIIMAIIAELVKCDYGSQGIVYVSMLYFLRKSRLLQSAGFLIMYMVTTGNQPTIFIVVAALIILLYNGKRGNLSIKYFFYWFYPVHISLLYGASLLFK